MKLTTKGRFAVTALLDLAQHELLLAAPVALSEISQRQNISLAYLEQLFAQMRRRGLVCSVRGPHGGYRLARPPQQVSVAEIVQAVDERLDATRCGGKGHCTHAGTDGYCITHGLWSMLTRKLLTWMSSVSLQDLLNQRDPTVLAGQVVPVDFC